MLHDPAFTFFTAKEIRPEGWLLNQLKIQARGLSGKLDTFWPDIKDSKWIGGQSEGWERVPYWLDGFIPLAWLLDDQDLKDRARYYIDEILARQAEDGWICPDQDQARADYDIWAKLLLLKVLVVYHDCTGDARIKSVIERALKALDRHIDHAPLFNWGMFRWFEGLIPIWWLYSQTKEDWLLDLAVKLKCQGFDWQAFFQHWSYKKATAQGRWSYMNHVVNNAMMLKSAALFWRLTGLEEDMDFAKKAAAQLDLHHGMVTGVFSGDECLAGKSPIRGTELCAVAEHMYSLEQLVSLTGQAKWSDRLEKIAFNALPATFSPDMWTHQYDQQVNQVECSRQEDPVFGTNSGEANLFGLEPNYGCCTANLSQPWPKFALATFMQSPDGLVVTAYAPARLKTEQKGVGVKLQMVTDYPFRSTIDLLIETEAAVDFDLTIRVPGWARQARLELGPEIIPLEKPGFFTLKRLWQAGLTRIRLSLPMEIELLARPDQLFALARGPLIYALPIKEKWLQINQDKPGHEFPHCDYEVLPDSPWNYGLALDQQALASLEIQERELGPYPFSPEGAPVRINVPLRQIDWQMEKGAATPRPGLAWTGSRIEKMDLLPYGCTSLRLTEMPLV